MGRNSRAAASRKLESKKTTETSNAGERVHPRQFEKPTKEKTITEGGKNKGILQVSACMVKSRMKGADKKRMCKVLLQ